MPTITFESHDGSRQTTAEAPAGGALADICDDTAAPIPFSCRSASCATCHIEVIEGADGLLPPEPEELDVLDAIGAAPPKFRLACCAKAKGGAGRIIVRAQNEY
jgi:2Fe-2S ferredoxin